MARTTRISISALLLASVLAAAYSAWGLHRVSPSTLMADDLVFPRDYPYPDYLILWLNDWYDRHFPVPEGYIKFHAELPRVRLTFRIFFGVFAGSAILWSAFLFASWRYHRSRPPNQPLQLSSTPAM